MNKRIAKIALLALLAAGMCGWAAAQAKEEPPDRAVVPLTNPGKPAKIGVSVMRGSITVKAYEGKDVIVEARVREKALGGYVGGLYSTGNYAVAAPPAPPAKPATAPTPAPGQMTKQQAKEFEAAIAAQMAEQEALAKKITGYAKAVDLYGGQFQDDKKRREEKEKKIAGMKQLSGTSSGLEIEENDNVVEIRTESWKTSALSRGNGANFEKHPTTWVEARRP
jgi:hypothetical protein